MNVSMKLQIRFNRFIDRQKDYISPGGYVMLLNGKVVQFDFITSYGNVSETESDVCIFELSDPDTEAFPDFETVTPEEIRNISEIIECFVYTGETTDLEVKEIERIIFFLPDDGRPIFEISKEIIDRFNTKSKLERSGMKWASI